MIVMGISAGLLVGWDIVVAPDAIASEVYAAEEFQKHLAMASGPKLPIVKAAKRPDRHIFIGPGTAMRASAAGFKIDDLGPEDLRIIVRGVMLGIQFLHGRQPGQYKMSDVLEFVRSSEAK